MNKNVPLKNRFNSPVELQWRHTNRNINDLEDGTRTNVSPNKYSVASTSNNLNSHAIGLRYHNELTLGQPIDIRSTKLNPVPI